jgi:hypothetical protein
VSKLRDLAGGFEHPSPGGVALDDAGVGFGVDRGGCVVDQVRDVGGTAGLFELAGVIERSHHGEVVDGFAPGVDVLDRVPNPAVTHDEEVFGFEEPVHVEQDFGVDQDRTQHRFFGFDRVRRDPGFVEVCGHIASPKLVLQWTKRKQTHGNG